MALLLKINDSTRSDPISVAYKRIIIQGIPRCKRRIEISTSNSCVPRDFAPYRIGLTSRLRGTDFQVVGITQFTEVSGSRAPAGFRWYRGSMMATVCCLSLTNVEIEYKFWGTCVWLLNHPSCQGCRYRKDEGVTPIEGSLKCRLSANSSFQLAKLGQWERFLSFRWYFLYFSRHFCCLYSPTPPEDNWPWKRCTYCGKVAELLVCRIIT